MAVSDGFWSYVHVDDDAEGGRIAQLARDVASQFEMLTGEPINLFLDRDNLVWGDDWRPAIDASLSSIAFFIPIVTPRFFKSIECRRELNFFARNAEKLGMKELVLPILYVDFPALREDPPADDLVAMVNRFQWEDWTDLKFADRQSGEYRRAVSSLAGRLVDANAAADRAAAEGKLLAGSTLEEIDEPGMLDTLGVMEDAFPDMNRIIIEIGRTIEEIGEAMQASTDNLHHSSSQSTGLAARLTVARKLANELAEPSTRIRELGNGFASNLHDVDGGVRILIGRASEEILENPESKTQFLSFFGSVRDMVSQSESGLGAVQSMIDSMAPIEKMSRDLRAPLRTLREGLTLLVDGLSVMRSWLSFMDEAESKIDLQEVPEMLEGASLPGR